MDQHTGYVANSERYWMGPSASWLDRFARLSNRAYDALTDAVAPNGYPLFPASNCSPQDMDEWNAFRRRWTSHPLYHAWQWSNGYFCGLLAFTRIKQLPAHSSVRNLAVWRDNGWHWSDSRRPEGAE